MENKKMKILVTIVATIIIGFLGIYTFYNVFIAQGEEVKIDNNNHNNEPSTQVIAQGLLKTVPCLMHTSSAYRIDETRFTSLDYSIANNVILNYLKNNNEIMFDYNIPSFVEFKENNCSEENGKTCYLVSQEQMESTAKLLYGKNVKIKFDDFLIHNNNENKCIVNENNYFCQEDEITNFGYSGKISKIEGIKVDEKYMYVYEKAIFVVNAVTTPNQDGYDITFETLLQTTNDENKIAEGIIITSPTEDYTDILINKYSSDIKLYKNIFEKTDDNKYFWLGTEIVEDTSK